MIGFIRKTIVITLVTAVALLTHSASFSKEFNPDKILSRPELKEGVKKIKNNSEAKDFFLTHSKAFGVSKITFDFIDKFSGGSFESQIDAIMTVPKNRWDMHFGRMGGYRIENVKEIVIRNRRINITSRLSTTMTRISNGLQVISIARDMIAGYNGDDAKKLSAIEGTVNLVQGYIISEYGGKALGLAMLGPAFIGKSLKAFMSEAKVQYGAYWWEAYSSYLNARYPNLVSGDNSWAALSEIEGYAGIERRLYEFWDKPYEYAGTYYGKAEMQTAPDLAERTLRDKFAARYYQDYIHKTLKTYYRRKAEQAEAEALIRAKRAYSRLMSMIDDFNVIQEAVKAAEELMTEENDVVLMVKQIDTLVADAEALSRESQKYCSKAKYRAAEAQDAASTLREEAQQLKEQVAKLAPEVDRMRELQTRISREHKNAETATAKVEQTTSKIEELSLQICRKAKALANASQTRAEQLLTQIEKLGADLKMLRSQCHKYADEADTASRNAEKNAAAFAGIADRLARLGDQDDLADILMEKQQLLDKADRNLAANREKIQQLAVKNKQARGLIAEAASLLHTHDYQKNEKSHRKQLNELTGRLKRTVRNAESCQSQARKASQNAREALGRVMEKVIAASASRKDLLRGSRATQKDPDRVIEKAELAEFLAQLAQGYVEEIENLAADSTFCLILARDHTEKSNFIALPDLRGKSADQAQRLLRAKGFQVLRKNAGQPPRQQLANKVKNQKPASGEKVRTGATVTLEVYAQFDPQALLADVDCSNYPNTEPAYDSESGRTGCACKPFFVPDTNGAGCVDCQQLKKSFHQLLRQNRLKSAEGQLARAGNCAFQEQAHAEISMHRNRIIACEKRNTAILRAVRQRDTQSAYSQIRNAQDFGCKVDPEVISIYNQLAQQVQREAQLHAEQRRQREQREAFNTFIQGMNAITQNIERQRHQDRNPPPRTRRNNPLTGALPSANPGDPLNDYSFSTSPEPAGSRHTGVSSGGQSSTTTGGTAGSGMSRSDCIKKFCPVCLQQSEVTMIGVSADEQCEDCKKQYAAKIAACEKGTSTGSGNTLESFQKYYLYKCWFKKVGENYERTYYTHYMTGPGEPSLGSRKRAEVNSQKSQCISCERIMGPDTREKIRLGGGSDLRRHYIHE